ncbi:MAG TPA: ASCH domain-containing protein [Thermoanaerobaculia bacterium]
MLFTKYLRDGVRSGAITRSVRIWMHPKVTAGKRYAFEGGEIEIEAIEPITLNDITPKLARECGFKSAEDLLKVARHGRGENVYLVDFHYIPRR